MNDLDYLKKYLKRKSLEDGISDLEKGIPVQYIVGDVDFLGFKFLVDENVLIPRFETEDLVSRLIAYSTRIKDPIKAVDLGTGSGCIAISLAKKLKAEVSAVDISSSALGVARKNAKLNDVEISFYEGNMLDPLDQKYNIIVSNPPYIDPSEVIQESVYNNEPHLALFIPGGIQYYYDILSSALNYLMDSSIIAFEIGESQGESVVNMARDFFPNSEIKLEKDLQFRDRFVFIFNNC